MEAVSLMFLKMSVAAGALILAIFALRLALRGAPMLTRCVLCGLAVVCLMFTFSFGSATPLYAASAKSLGPVSVALATDESLKKYPSYSELAIKSDEFAQRLVLSTNAAVSDFKLIKVGWKEEGDKVVFFEDGALYKTTELTPQKPLVVWVSFPGSLPTTGISFKDKSGATQRCFFEMSGEDGSILLRKF